MTPLHPKLNWEAFERERARRKRRKFFWWYGATFGMSLLVWSVASLILQEESTKSKRQSQHGAEKGHVLINNRTALLEDVPISEMEHGVVGMKLKQSNGFELVNQAMGFIQTDNPDGQLKALAHDNTSVDVPEANLTIVRKDENTATSIATIAQTDPMQLHQFFEENEGSVVKLLTSTKVEELPKSERTIKSYEQRGKKSPTSNDWLLQFGWIPWHSAGFEITENFGKNSLKYMPLNSFSFALGVELFEFNETRIYLDPQYVCIRFQMQFEGGVSSYEIEPGSVIGYSQGFKGIIEPIVSDTVRGVAQIGAKQNGSLHEFLFPLNASTNMIRFRDWKLDASVSLGVQYVLALEGTWFNGSSFYSLEPPTRRLGLLGGGGLAITYHPGKLVYQLSVSSMYRSAMVEYQVPWRKQLLLAVVVPLSK